MLSYHKMQILHTGPLNIWIFGSCCIDISLVLSLMLLMFQLYFKSLGGIQTQEVEYLAAELHKTHAAHTEFTYTYICAKTKITMVCTLPM